MEQRSNAQNGAKIRREMKNGRNNGEKYSQLRKEKNGQTNGSLIGTKDISRVQTGDINMTITWRQSIIGVKNGITKGN